MSFGTLFVTYPSGRMEIAELEKPTVTIGTSPENDIVIQDEAADPFHAQLLCDPTGCQVFDLGSANGTTWHGMPLSPYLPEILEDQDVFVIGATNLTFCLPEPDEPMIEEESLEPEPSWWTRTRIRLIAWWDRP